MAKGDLKKFIKRRPPWFWWVLANLLAAALAVASWSICLHLFNFPERPANYNLLRKLKRLTPVASYDPLEAPDGSSANEEELLTRFYSLDREQLAAHNWHFKRNYITNFQDPHAVTYVEGTYRLTHARSLTPTDFFHPGLALRVQAIVQTDELARPSPYPVILEVLLPTDGEPDRTFYPEGHTFELKKIDHRAAVLHAARIGSANEPTVCLTVVPLAFSNYLDSEGNPLPLSAPDPLNVTATFPVMEENRTE